MWLYRWVSEWSVLMFDIPLMELKHESVAIVKALVFGASMATGESQELLVPATAGFYIPDTD